MSHPNRSLPSVVLASLAVTLGACRGSLQVSGSPHPRPVPVHFESEPNDAAFDADFVGAVGGSQRLVVHGDLQAEYGDVDGFAFVPTEPILVEFALAVHDPYGDLAVCIYDPALDEYVACYDSVYDEKGAFDVLDPGREFHIVVYSEHFDCGSSYDLDLLISRLVYGPEAAPGPDDTDTADVFRRPALPRSAGTPAHAAPDGVRDYGRARPAPRPTPRPASVAVGQGLRLILEPSGEVAAIEAGALVRRPAAR